MTNEERLPARRRRSADRTWPAGRSEVATSRGEPSSRASTVDGRPQRTRSTNLAGRQSCRAIIQVTLPASLSPSHCSIFAVLKWLYQSLFI